MLTVIGHTWTVGDVELCPQMDAALVLGGPQANTLHVQVAVQVVLHLGSPVIVPGEFLWQGEEVQC
jgi:hypothetical protein